MARASDFTYLARAIFISWTFLWFLQHVWNIDRFEALKWKRLKKHDLKSAITIILVIMCPLQAFFDITTTILKYQEGYLVNPFIGEIITRPDELWNKAHEKWIIPTNYILCANFSLQTCLLFLLQSFWNYLAKNLAKTSFMGSFEFKSYIVYAFFSIFIFPFLQYIFRKNTIYTEVAPQLAYSTFMFLIALFGIRSHKRFTNLLITTKKSSASQIYIISKLEYFRDMNRYLTWSLFVGSMSFLILSIDSLTPERYLFTHKFSADLLMCHINFSLWLVFVTLMLIFYPSSNTISDSIALSKAVSFSEIAKSSLKSDLLEPPTPRWLRSEESQLISQVSSQVSSQQTNSQFDYSVELCDELPPPVITPYHERKSNSLDIPPILPSPYHSSPISSIINLPPPPPLLPTKCTMTTTTNSLKVQQKQPSYATPVIQSSISSIKQSNKIEKLKYPSSPLLLRNDVNINDVNKILNDDRSNQNSLVDSTFIYTQPFSENFPPLVDSIFDPFVELPSPKKSSRRASITSNDNSPVIRVTTSTNSLRSVNSVTLPSSDEEDKELSKNLDPFMYQNEPVQQETISSSNPIIIINTGGRQEESGKSSIIPTSSRLQQNSSPVQYTPISSTDNKNKNNDNSNDNISLISVGVHPKSKSFNTPRTPWITARPYQSSPLGPGDKNDNEITSSFPSSTKASFVQINNNPKARSGNESVNNSTDGPANNVIRNNPVRDNIISTRDHSNSTASVGSGKVSSPPEKKGVRNSVKNNMNNVSNSVRNSIAKGRTRSNSNSTASVGGTRNSIIKRIKSENKTTRRERSTSSASDSSNSSTSSLSESQKY